MNEFRFYNEEKQGEKMEIVSFEDLVTTARADLAKLPKMQSLGILSGEGQVFARDILLLDARKIAETEMFWHSNLGQEMNKKGFDECLVHVSTDKFLEINFHAYMKKDGQFVSVNDYYETPTDDPHYEEGKNAYRVSDTGSMFIRYLCTKGAVVVGNSYEHPNLLPAS